jgi:hypothetical protein
MWIQRTRQPLYDPADEPVPPAVGYLEPTGRQVRQGHRGDTRIQENKERRLR